MINPFKEVNWKPSLREKRTFALSLMIGFPCVAVVLLCLRRVATGSWGFEAASWIGGAGFAVGLVLWLFPGIARPFYVIWYCLACCMGIVLGNTLLAAFYFTVLSGVGLCLRAVGKGRLRKGFSQAASYWLDAEKTADPGRYYRQF